MNHMSGLNGTFSFKGPISLSTVKIRGIFYREVSLQVSHYHFGLLNDRDKPTLNNKTPLRFT